MYKLLFNEKGHVVGASTVQNASGETDAVFVSKEIYEEAMYMLHHDIPFSYKNGVLAEDEDVKDFSKKKLTELEARYAHVLTYAIVNNTRVRFSDLQTLLSLTTHQVIPVPVMNRVVMLERSVLAGMLDRYDKIARFEFFNIQGRFSCCASKDEVNEHYEFAKSVLDCLEVRYVWRER